jgi:hypothetical protein
MRICKVSENLGVGVGLVVVVGWGRGLKNISMIAYSNQKQFFQQY